VNIIVTALPFMIIFMVLTIRKPNIFIFSLNLFIILALIMLGYKLNATGYLNREQIVKTLMMLFLIGAALSTGLWIHLINNN